VSNGHNYSIGDKRYPLSVITIVAAAVVKLFTAHSAAVFNFRTCNERHVIDGVLSFIIIIVTTFFFIFFTTCFVRNTELDGTIYTYIVCGTLFISWLIIRFFCVFIFLTFMYFFIGTNSVFACRVCWRIHIFWFTLVGFIENITLSFRNTKNNSLR
jgi:hypothetical protein